MVRGVRTRNALHFACLSRTLADADLLDWVGRLLRWGHVIVAIAWLGTSFHFFLPDNSLMRVGVGVGVGWAWTGPWVGLRRWHKARLRRGSHAQGLDRGGPSIAEARDALAARRVVQSGMLRQIEGRPLQSVLRRLRQHMLDEQRALDGTDSATRASLAGSKRTTVRATVRATVRTTVRAQSG